MSHLVWAASTLLNKDQNHRIMVILSSKVDWQSPLSIRQEWVSPCLKKFLHTGEVTLLAGEVERCGFCSVSYVDIWLVFGEEQLEEALMTVSCCIMQCSVLCGRLPLFQITAVLQEQLTHLSVAFLSSCQQRSETALVSWLLSLVSWLAQRRGVDSILLLMLRFGLYLTSS